VITTVLNRVIIRLESDDNYDENIVSEYVQTITDRLCLRLGVTEDTFPELFNSIAVDATVKMWRRTYYEGISSEGAANITTSFVDDILSEYADEISAYLENTANTSGTDKVVHFK